MALTRDKKKDIIEKVGEIAKTAGSVVFATFHGLGISDEQELRQALKDADISYTVTKKRLAKLAFEKSAIEGSLPELSGELALVYGADQVAPAREFNVFAKKHKDQLHILGGVFENRYMNAEEMQEIAQIPSRGTLYAQIANVINSPIQGIVIGLNALAEKKEA